jgi:O-acetyl-ADP-ribose deacetylase (regulator of RNase III)
MSFDEPTTEESLYDSVKNSLLRAAELNLLSIAFPAIGTGVADFDPQRCAEIMLSEIIRLLPEAPRLERVEIVLLDPDIYRIFQEEYQRL